MSKQLVPAEYARDLAESYLDCAIQSMQQLAEVLDDCEWQERPEYKTLDNDVLDARYVLDHLKYDIDSIFRTQLVTDDDCESPPLDDEDADYPVIEPPSSHPPEGNKLITDYFLKLE